jgi:hypothetical protein
VIKEHNVAIIPNWVYDTMKRNALTISDCLNFNVVRKFMSAEDMASILVTERSFDRLTGDVALAGMSPPTITSRWIQSATEENRNFLMNTVLPISHSATVINMANERLFSEHSKEEHHKDPFIIYELERGVSGIIVYPGFFTTDSAPGIYKHLVDAVLGALYVNSDSPNIVSGTRWFRRYLELLNATVQQ